MKIALWKHPSNPDNVRAYINGVEGLPKTAKAYLQAKGKGSALVCNPESCRPVVMDALHAAGLLGKGRDVPSVDFSVYTEYGAVPRRKKASTASPNHIPNPGAGGADHTAEAELLDLSTIKVPDEVTITIDHREPKELLDLFDGLPNVTVELAELPVGDILLNGRIAIERKCCTGDRTDFEASIIDDEKRLFFQSEKLRLDDSITPIVLLEGPVYENSRSMLIQQIDGAVSFLTAIQGLSVVNTLSIRHTAYFALKLATHDRSGLGYDLALRPKKPKLLSDQLAFTLEGMPGISANTAKKIAEVYPSLAAVCSATREDLLKIPGMGPKRLEGVWAILHGEGVGDTAV